MLLLSLLACSDPMVMSGSVVGKSFNNPLTTFWGGPFLFISPQELDCMDVSFVSRNYSVGVAPAEFDFTALQLSWADGDSPSLGIFDLTPDVDAAVSAKVLVNEGGAFTDYRADSGTLEVVEFEEEGELLGNFSIDFDGEVLQSDPMILEYCVNLSR